MNFELTADQQGLQSKCRALAADFATRSAAHDREASHPVETSNFCLYNLGLYALGLDRAEVLPPMKPEQAPPGNQDET